MKTAERWLRAILAAYIYTGDHRTARRELSTMVSVDAQRQTAAPRVEVTPAPVGDPRARFRYANPYRAADHLRPWHPTLVDHYTWPTAQVIHIGRPARELVRAA